MDICLYIRMSTNMQENSVESQQQVLRAYAKNHHMDIIQEYIDEGISGREAHKRPSFMQMIEDSAKSMFEAVLIYDSSRFARNLEESIVYKSLLKKNGVTLISATEPTLDDDTSLITDALLGAMNEMYSRKLSKAVRRGMDFKAQQGYCLGQPPFGYESVGKSGIPRIKEDEAAIVRLVFDLFINTIPTYSGVAKALNERGYTLRSGGAWESRSTKRILNNRTYAGYCAWQFDSKEPYEGKQQAIVDRAVYKAAQDIISKMPDYRTRDNATYSHWLSGIFFCGSCGSLMTFNPNKPRNVNYFRCRKNAAKICSPTVQINVLKAEAIVNKILNDILHNTDFSKYDNIVIADQSDDRRTRLELQIEKCNKKIKRFSEAYSEGIDTLAEYKTNKQNITAQITELKKELAQLKNGKPSQSAIKKFQGDADAVITLLESSEISIMDKNNAVRRIIKKIIYTRNTDSVLVFLNL